MWDVDWHPSGKILATCGQDRVIRLWSLTHDAWKASDLLRDAHTKTIRRISFSPDGRKLAAAGFDGIVSIWVQAGDARGDGSGWRCAANLEGHENEVKCVCWSPDGRLLATCGRDKTIWLWEVNPGEDEHNDVEEVDFECLAVLAEHTQDVKCVIFHPIDSHTLVSASYDDTIKIWKADAAHDDEWTCRQTLADHSSTVWKCDFSPCGNFLVSVGEDLRIIIYRRHEGKFIVDLVLDCAHDRAILAVAVQRELEEEDEEDKEEDDGGRKLLFATSSSDRSVKLWCYSTHSKELVCLDTFLDPDRVAFNSLQWNPIRRDQLAACGDVGRVMLFQIKASAE